MEELIPMVAKLAEQYTAGESTSISYERAEQLMEAVLYCIREAEESGENVPVKREKPSPAELYEIGVECVLTKVKEALRIYHEILPRFDSYGNRCLEETFQKGLPEFFRWYDVRFAPQDHMILLDYPVCKDLSQEQGIDKVYEFLLCIREEQKFLRHFPRNEILRLLRDYCEEPEDMIENLSDIVRRGSESIHTSFQDRS